MITSRFTGEGLQLEEGNLVVTLPADDRLESRVRASLIAIERAYPGIYTRLPEGMRIEIFSEQTSIRPEWALANVHYPPGCVQASLTGAPDSRFREAPTVEQLLGDIATQFAELFYYEKLPHEDVLWSYPVFELTADAIVDHTTSGGRLVVTETSVQYCPAIGRATDNEHWKLPRGAVASISQQTHYVAPAEPKAKGWRGRLQSMLVSPSSHPYMQIEVSGEDEEAMVGIFGEEETQQLIDGLETSAYDSVAFAALVSAYGEPDTKRLFEECYSVVELDIVPSVRLPRSKPFLEQLTLSGMDRQLRAQAIEELDEWTSEKATFTPTASPPAIFEAEPFERTTWDGVTIYYHSEHHTEDPVTELDPYERGNIHLRTKSGGELPSDAYVYLVSFGENAHQATLAVGHRSLATIGGNWGPQTLQRLFRFVGGDPVAVTPNSAASIRRQTTDIEDSINRPHIKAHMFDREIERSMSDESTNAFPQNPDIAYDFGGDGLTDAYDVVTLIEAADPVSDFSDAGDSGDGGDWGGDFGGGDGGG